MIKKRKVTGLALGLFTLFLLIASLLPTKAFANDLVPVDISVEKKLNITGKAPEHAENFEFIISSVNGEPMPATGNKLTILGQGKASFGTINYSRPGNYYYQISEKSGTNSKYTYDHTVYNVKVNISYKGNQLVSTMTVRKNGSDEKESAITFNNSYKGDERPSEKPSEEPSKPKTSTETGHAKQGKSVTTGSSLGEDKVLWIIAVAMSISIVVMLIIAKVIRNKKKD